MKILTTISDKDVLNVAELLLINSIFPMYNYTFEKIERQKYENQDGCDAEESISVHFKANPKVEDYRPNGWNDCLIMIKIIIHDRYVDFSHFTGHRREENDKTWGTFWISNHIEASLYLQNNNLFEI